MRAFALVAAVALCAHAEPGFFSPPERHVEDSARPQVGFVLDSSMPCSLVTSYNTTTPAAIQVQFAGVVNGPGCMSTMAQAVASTVIFKVLSVGGEPANPPHYLCNFTLQWNPASPTSPEVVASPDLEAACGPFRGQALAALRAMI